MNNTFDDSLRAKVCSILEDTPYVTRLSGGMDCTKLQGQTISADGSTRQFFRIMYDNQNLGLAILPGGLEESKMREADSVFFIGSHLNSHGINSPDVLGREKKSGLVVLQDLGDTRLHDRIKECKKQGDSGEQTLYLYKAVIDKLLPMQFSAITDFDPSWCWDTGYYDRDVMMETESGYFETSFLHSLMGKTSPEGLHEEFADIAECAGRGVMKSFLHRDFQSRNIMLLNNQPYFIDFQGGRIGPPGYDVASLLLDPYVSLPDDMQAQLLEYYLDGLEKYPAASRDEFQQTFWYLKLQRLLQITGAFSFLWQQKNKPFFKDFIRPSLVMMKKHLQEPATQKYAVLQGVVDAALPAYDEKYS